MRRRVAVLILALALNPALLYAQESSFTVTAASADVYKGPTTATPVLGHVAQGTVVTVSRNLGSWVRVPWPDAPDGFAYIHVSMGRLGSEAAPASTSAARATGSSPASSSTRLSETHRVAPRRTITPTPESHLFGIGGMLAPTSSFGATARAWRDNRIGVQLGIARDTRTSDVAAGRVTSMQVDPGLVYALFDRVTDYVWIRPYVGSTVGFRRQTFTVADPLPASASAKGIGVRVFAGSELMFASAPRFGLSVDVGYRRFPTPYQGFETDPLSVSIAAHWYIK